MSLYWNAPPGVAQHHYLYRDKDWSYASGEKGKAVAFVRPEFYNCAPTKWMLYIREGVQSGFIESSPRYFDTLEEAQAVAVAIVRMS